MLLFYGQRLGKSNRGLASTVFCSFPISASGIAASLYLRDISSILFFFFFKWRKASDLKPVISKCILRLSSNKGRMRSACSWQEILRT